MFALTNSLTQYQAELAEIRSILLQRSLTSLEYRAAERTLQVSIEACIGVAKHWAKALAGHSPQDAYQAFEILAQHQQFPSGQTVTEQLSNWRKTIGLRNVLVHDYLNIDPEVVRSVIREQYSDQLFEFAEMGLDWLSANAP